MVTQGPGKGVVRKVKNLPKKAPAQQQERLPRHIRLGKFDEFKRVVFKIIAQPVEISSMLRDRPMPEDAGSELIFLKGKTELIVENAPETAIDLDGVLSSLSNAGFKWARLTDKIREKDGDVEVRISLKRERERGHENIGDAQALCGDLDDFVGFCWIQLMFHKEPSGNIQKSLNVELRRSYRMQQRPIQQVTALGEGMVLQEILD